MPWPAFNLNRPANEQAFAAYDLTRFIHEKERTVSVAEVDLHLTRNRCVAVGEEMRAALELGVRDVDAAVGEKEERKEVPT